MRISTRWTWIPLAITVAGVVYLSMVKIARYQARLNEPQVVHPAPLPFVPPPLPAKREPAAVPAPPDDLPAPARPQVPAIPGTELPAFRPHK